MFDESEFHELVEAFLERLAEEIELKDDDMLIDVDLNQGILTLELDSGQQYVISKHLPSQQVWLSSPMSGGLHYDYSEELESWELVKDGTRLDEHLAQELYQLTSIAFDFIGE
ncbi:MAG: iron donor protein CyaY [Rickettsiales bacterium]|nr:iron donor protein CyaY [Rickettsiales bacterium]